MLPIHQRSAASGALLSVVLMSAFTPVQAQQYYNYREIRPVEGPNYNGWYRYEKPADLNESLMQAAGAAFYSGPSACANTGYCLSLNGTWASKQSTLRIPVNQTVYPPQGPVIYQPQPGTVIYQPQPQSPVIYQPQPQGTVIYQPPSQGSVIYQPQPQPGPQVPINQGYNQVGGIWFGPDGQPVPADRRPGEDQATCISRLRFFNLQADSRSDTHGDYRYSRPAGVTVQQMQAAGLENRSFLGEKWRGVQPQVVITLAGPQEATIRCR